MRKIIDITFVGHDHYVVTYERLNKIKKKLTSNGDAVGRYQNREVMNPKEIGQYNYTLKQAVKLLTEDRNY